MARVGYDTISNHTSAAANQRSLGLRSGPTESVGVWRGSCEHRDRRGRADRSHRPTTMQPPFPSSNSSHPMLRHPAFDGSNFGASPSPRPPAFAGRFPKRRRATADGLLLAPKGAASCAAVVGVHVPRRPTLDRTMRPPPRPIPLTLPPSTHPNAHAGACRPGAPRVFSYQPAALSLSRVPPRGQTILLGRAPPIRNRRFHAASRSPAAPKGDGPHHGRAPHGAQAPRGGGGQGQAGVVEQRSVGRFA